MKYEIIKKLAKFIPESTRIGLRKYVSLTNYDLYNQELNNPYANEPISIDFPSSRYTFGIIKEFAQYHQNYIAACKEMGVSYRIIDISGTDWIQNVLKADCDAYLVWPSSYLSIWKEMFDDRLRIMEEELGLIIYPSLKEIWLDENKRRVRDWLEANLIPHPKSWVFYNEHEAMEFINSTKFPIVFKTNIGAAASGVWILRNQAGAKRIIRKAFRKGIVARGRDPRDNQWGVVYLQEYFSNVQEFRMIRIGDSYYGYKKEKVGDFHSGSHQFSFFDPSKKLLDFTYEITKRGSFTSMSVDIFETEDGQLWVNELQTVSGVITVPPVMLMVNGKTGRYYRDMSNDEWIFEEGDFSRNACANNRVEYLISQLDSL